MWEAGDKEVILSQITVRNETNESCYTCDKLNLCRQLVRQYTFGTLVILNEWSDQVWSQCTKKEVNKCNICKENHFSKQIDNWKAFFSLCFNNSWAKLALCWSWVTSSVPVSCTDKLCAWRIHVENTGGTTKATYSHFSWLFKKKNSYQV